MSKLFSSYQNVSTHLFYLHYLADEPFIQMNVVAGYAAYYFAMYFTHSMKLSIHIGRKPGKTFCVQKIYRILKCISTQRFIIRFFPFEDIQSSEIGDIPQVTKENCAISINCSFFAYL